MTNPARGGRDVCGRCDVTIMWVNDRHVWAATSTLPPGVSSKTLCRGKEGTSYLGAHVPRD